MALKRRRGIWAQLVYMDFLAGPGRGLDRTTKAEFDGSPLLALKIVPPFDRLYLSDADATNVNALWRRIPTIDASRVVVSQGDCH